MKSYTLLSGILVLVFSLPIYFGFGGNKIPQSTFTSAKLDPKFQDYWYQGKAEVSSYDLEQSRYGEVHPGHAVLVFVTEDFSKSKQVKLDNPSKAGEDALSVLKLNFVKKFNTGIYRYSILESVFTPVNIEQYPNSLKVTTSIQEWCGHAFTQLNLKRDNYQVNSFSYFESEGDQTYNLDKTILEDEIWNRIRIAPESLPLGNLRIIPSTINSRLIHRPLQAERAKANLKTSEIDENINVYTLEYPEAARSLSIHFEKAFPHKIIGWEETYPGIPWQAKSKKLTTRAKIKETLFTKYWNQHSLKDAELRKKLGLS